MRSHHGLVTTFWSCVPALSPKTFSFVAFQVKGKDDEMTLQCHMELITVPHPPPLPQLPFARQHGGETFNPLSSPLSCRWSL